jgi:anti-sigma factor RsiW
MSNDVTCRELVGLVTDLFDGALPSGMRARVAHHLSYCGSCRRYLRQMRQTMGALRSLVRGPSQR